MGGSASTAYASGKRSKGNVVGTKRWFDSLDLDSPIYFDTSYHKSRKCGARYELYKHAKTLKEYLDLHPKGGKGEEYRDFEWDFSKGHVKLLPSGALMSLDLNSRAALSQVTVGCVSAEVPLGICDLRDDLADRIFQATATIPSLPAGQRRAVGHGLRLRMHFAHGQVRGASPG